MSQYGGAVDDAIAREVYPNGEQPSVGFPPPFGGADQLKSMQAALEVIERHLEPVTSENLAGIALLRYMGGDRFNSIADLWLANHHLRGAAGPLVESLEYASLAKQFKGVQGSLFGGRRGIFGGAPSGPGGLGR